MFSCCSTCGGVLKNDAEYKDICAAMKTASESSLKGILGHKKDKVVTLKEWMYIFIYKITFIHPFF